MAKQRLSVLIGILAGVTAMPALAQSTETAAMHVQGRVGGKVCMIEHEHYGEGNLPTRKGAERAAVRAWESFTVWEYGKSWGSYARALSSRMACAQADGRWTCKTTAKPCRK